jgi:hypothetical protein
VKQDEEEESTGHSDTEMKGKPIDEEDPYMPTLYDLNQPSFKPAKRKSKLEYLDDRLQKERFRDEYFFM